MLDEHAVPADALQCYRLALKGPLLDILETAEFLFDRDWVFLHLPHRQPFVFVDGVQAIQGATICALFDVDQRADLFTGHFPDVPRWPGVIQIEAMAQAGLMLYFANCKETRNEVALGVVREARFLREVLPGRPVQLLSSFFEDGLFLVLVGQVLQAQQVCSVCILSIV